MPQDGQTAPSNVTIEMRKYSDHKAVARYKATSPNAIVTDVYVSKQFAAVMPRDIILTVKEPD
jgi:hypothetical protein